MPASNYGGINPKHPLKVMTQKTTTNDSEVKLMSMGKDKDSIGSRGGYSFKDSRSNDAGVPAMNSVRGSKSSKKIKASFASQNSSKMLDKP